MLELLAEITGTDIFKNVKTMFRTAMIPFLMTCVVYFFQGSGKLAADGAQSVDIFRESFCLAVQQMSVLEIIRVMLTGFYPKDDPKLLSMLGGGGVLSMVNVGLIVCISASYSGIFERTGLLNRMSAWIEGLAGRIRCLRIWYRKRRKERSGWKTR